MRQYKYPNHREYVAIQTSCNKGKLNTVWVTRADIEIVARHIKEQLPDARFGICHGTRRGVEQAWLREILGIEVIGTEISDTAEQFPNTIQWDFHDVKDEWLGAVDFIYSNALDHSWNPRFALDQWMRCLRVGGLCFVDWSREHGEAHVNSADCFGASVQEMREFLSFNPYEELTVGDRFKDHVAFVLKKSEKSGQ